MVIVRAGRTRSSSVAYVGGQTNSYVRTAVHCQITAAARSFWPRLAGSVEKRSPAPFGSEPSGRSIARAASATAAAEGAVSASDARRCRQDVMEQRPRRGESGERLLGLLGGRVLGGSVDRVLRVVVPVARCRRPRHPSRRPATSPRISRTWRPPPVRARTAGTRRSAGRRRRCRSHRRPSSPAKSGSHSAIVEPMSAPTRRSESSIACRNAMPSGMCEARMITSGRAAARSAMTAGQSGRYRLYDARVTTGIPRSTAVASAASATVRA